ncbi:hypothetical protein RUM43_013263 [Polyplax serrata]|uniref:Uncharacterized protein n=1 Tax=Polyplax serrata TaxID=468196 RepID=A0AAN8NXL5_POLSC
MGSSNHFKGIGVVLRSIEVEIDKKPCLAPISKLRVEKIEGGIVVAGVVVAANCQIALSVFGCLFVLVGIVLTVASYRGPGQDEEPEKYAARLAFTGNSRILGPACIVVGFIMLSAGISLCALARKARRRERRVGFHCPIHGNFYPISPISASRAVGKFESKWGICFRRARSLTVEDLSHSLPQCPHTQLSSTRSSFSTPMSPCPTPMPFLVTSNSISSDLVISVGANLSPDQTFGSIRSLSVSREVASFPLSRTPSPPQHERSCSLGDQTNEKTRRDVITMENETSGHETREGSAQDEERQSSASHNAQPIMVCAKIIESPLLLTAINNVEGCDIGKKNLVLQITKGSRKSVSIIVPQEDNERQGTS